MSDKEIFIVTNIKGYTAFVTGIGKDPELQELNAREKFNKEMKRLNIPVEVAMCVPRTYINNIGTIMNAIADQTLDQVVSPENRSEIILID